MRAMTVARQLIGIAVPVIDADEHLIQHDVVQDAQ